MASKVFFKLGKVFVKGKKVDGESWRIGGYLSFEWSIGKKFVFLVIHLARNRYFIGVSNV